ncbi:Hypothetical_protein [Hexamita inflata]|uniref:Hypothetical_protein n=1 Tax=Hexamita inflata TaxID=28002 RepID=A0AA86RE93_9EUKA|nr:Hypothetical protein HINF_LOCUS62472 [Hexamita inflata]
MEQYFNLQLQLIQFQLANEKQQNILLQEQLSNEKALNQELINELENNQQQFVNHIHNIEEHYSLQQQQSEKEKRNLIQEIQSQTKINEILTHQENSLEQEIVYLIKNQGLSIFVAELYQAVSYTLNAVDNIDFSVDKNYLEKNLFATVQQLEDSQIITEAFWLDLTNKLQIELHLAKLLYQRAQYFSEKYCNLYSSDTLLKMGKLYFEYQQAIQTLNNQTQSISNSRQIDIKQEEVPQKSNKQENDLLLSQLENTYIIDIEESEVKQQHGPKRTHQDVVSQFFQSAKNILGRVFRVEVSALSNNNLITIIHQLKYNKKQQFLNNILQMNKQHFDSKQMVQKFINSLFKYDNKYETDSSQLKQSTVVSQNYVDALSQQQKEQVETKYQQDSENQCKQISKEPIQNNEELPVSQSEQLSSQQYNIVQQMNEQHDIKSQQSSFDDQRPLSQPTPEIISKIFYEAAKNVLSRHFNIQSENMNQSEISNQIDQLNQDQHEIFWEKIVQISNCFESVDAAYIYFTTTFKPTQQNSIDILVQPDEQEQLNNLNISLDQVSEPENEGKQQNITNQSITINELEIKSYEQETENKQKQDNKQKNSETQKFDQFTVAAKQILNQMYSEQNFLNMSPKELCEFMNSKKPLQKGFWQDMEYLCHQKSRTLQQYYSRTYSKVLYSENLNQNDKNLIKQLTKQILEIKNGQKLSSLEIARQMLDLHFSKRNLFIFEIEMIVRYELQKLKK